ncbi:unnamed protein product [Boreogadus saida]
MATDDDRAWGRDTQDQRPHREGRVGVRLERPGRVDGIRCSDAMSDPVAGQLHLGCGARPGRAQTTGTDTLSTAGGRITCTCTVLGDHRTAGSAMAILSVPEYCWVYLSTTECTRVLLGVPQYY